MIPALLHSKEINEVSPTNDNGHLTVESSSV